MCYGSLSCSCNPLANQAAQNQAAQNQYNMACNQINTYNTSLLGNYLGAQQSAIANKDCTVLYFSKNDIKDILDEYTKDTWSYERCENKLEFLLFNNIIDNLDLIEALGKLKEIKEQKIS